MQNIIKKTLIFVLTSVLFFSLPVFNVSAGENSRVNLPFAGESVNVKWSLSYFKKDAVKAGENKNLAVICMALCDASGNGSKAAEESLKKLGFKGIVSHHYDDDKLNYPGMTFAVNKKKVNGKWVVAAVFKGTDFNKNGDVQTDLNSVDDGFLPTGKNCLAELKDYIKNDCPVKKLSKKNTILFLTGHSLGAAAASEVTRLASGKVAYKKNIFSYVYGTPNYDTDGKKAGDYKNLHTYVNADDIVTKVPWDFGKLGTMHEYDYTELKGAKKECFDKVYEYFYGKSYEENDTFWRGHTAYAYMSFILSGMKDKEVNEIMDQDFI